jgi:excisionase family DNA binding protein
LTSDVLERFRSGEIVFLTVTEMAKITRLSRMSIYRLIDAGSLEVVRFGRIYRIPVDAARQFIEDGETGPA